MTFLKNFKNNICEKRGAAEVVFFALLTLLLFVKFYCLELAVSPIATRYPLSVAASLGWRC